MPVASRFDRSQNLTWGTREDWKIVCEHSGPCQEDFWREVHSYATRRYGNDHRGCMTETSKGTAVLVHRGYSVETEAFFMHVIEALQDNFDAAERLWTNYHDKLAAFRSEIKNDVSSLEASARRTIEAKEKLTRCYSEVFAQLTSQDMLRAIDNAERLAKALDAIAHLQAHRLMFAVVDQGAHGAGNGAP